MKHLKSLEEIEQCLIQNSEPGPNGCINWTGPINTCGYGKVGVRLWGVYSRELVHRLAAFIWKGSSRDSWICVCHKCDNRRCINPDHLFLGSKRENILDRDKKQRGAWGELHGRHKLTCVQISEIRSARNGGEILKSIALRYGVDTSQIWNICARKNWARIA